MSNLVSPNLKFTRYITVDFEPTPEEIADVFVNMNSEQQAAFFAHIKVATADWPGAGWCQQSYAIAKDLNAPGRDVLQTLVAHVFPGDDA